MKDPDHGGRIKNHRPKIRDLRAARETLADHMKSSGRLHPGIGHQIQIALKCAPSATKRVDIK